MLSREALAAALEELDTEVQRSLSADSVVALAAAARELLAGQKGTWCASHESFDEPDNPYPNRCEQKQMHGYSTPCRMVEAVLVIPE